jgi:Dolichyl-phosphate-mannose-protein mannosyltransferase
VAVLGAAVWLLYGRATDLWWTWDDFFNLRYLLAWSPEQYIFDPGVWRQLPFRTLIPLFFLSQEADLALFGLNPKGFYVHQLIAVGAAAAAVYALLRLWLPLLPAFAGGFLFLVAPPVASLAPYIMVRHYPEVILLLLLAGWSFVRAVRTRRVAWALVSAVLYLLAMLTREVAVPLLLLLPLLPEGELRTRLRLAVPHGVVLVLYLAFRIYMLGTPVGGYGWAVAPGDWPGLVASFPGKMGAELLGASTAAGWVAALAIGVALLLLAVRSRPAAVLLGAAVALVSLPFLPVSTEMSPRYAAPLAAVLAVAFAFAFSSLAGRPGAVRWAAWGLLAAACGGWLLVSRQVWAEDFASQERMSAENRFFLTLGPGDLLRHPAGPPAAMAELRRLKEENLGLARGAGWFSDDLYLCAGTRGGRVWGWNPAARRVEDVSATIPALRRSYCRGIRRRAPLSATFASRGPAVFWELGPYREGRWAFVFEDGASRVPVRARAGYQVGEGAKLSFRVRYESPEGWVTYSPELVMDFGRTPRFRWER